MKKIFFVTNNIFKEQEIRNFFLSNQSQKFNLLSLKDIDFRDSIPELGNSFEENALLKAEFFFEKTNFPCFSEDSGLKVEYLNGEPGIYSSRYSKTRKNMDNMKKLLSNMIKDSSRKAEFFCVFCLKINEKEIYFFKGKLSGTISKKIIKTQGFGYDPIFIPNDHKHTLSEMNIDQKNQISHRIKAFKKLIQFINNRNF
ncbi:RdgB/HAM1 family non-canonical purine NTP pyrophosphatase [Blattabacterium cuenoti]|uniref:RdgB/HAM1 family non-canonical purine NTP pyrophosphatase n=1 Tax=Blattabacterium cuenoti TaxID=1653831 RepID=UPI00163C6280|nr:RdgB/HAM1 family non-canonical purine NTP pyrophosphatase [Blattabacterium cuenoti]